MNIGMVVRLALVAAVAISLAGCIHPCEASKSDSVLKKERLGQFDRMTMDVQGKPMTVFRTRRSRSGPPILLLHEMPALSGSILQLAGRLEARGYDVYVPLLWGRVDDNAQSKLHASKVAAWSVFSSDWRTLGANCERGIVEKMEAVCLRIAKDRPGRRIGVIGNCISGPVPLALAARMPDLVSAPVLSQPANPFIHRDDLGISPADRDRLVTLAGKGGAPQVLVFRFEQDPASPAERVEALKRTIGADRVADGQIAVEYYVERDGMHPKSHSVLTNCYLLGEEHGAQSTRHAWKELLRFLDAKLKHRNPRTFKFEPYG